MTGKMVIIFKSGVERSIYADQEYLEGIANQLMKRTEMSVKIQGDSATWIVVPSEIACVELSND